MTKKNPLGYVFKLIIILIGTSLTGLTYAQDAKVAEYQTADAELKNTYKQLMEKLSAQDKEKLKESQRRWHAFRNVDCEYGLVDKFDCLVARTKERTQQLNTRSPSN
jgi:uncharacterized protein YecT (DUF1311 family)